MNNLDTSQDQRKSRYSEKQHSEPGAVRGEGFGQALFILVAQKARQHNEGAEEGERGNTVLIVQRENALARLLIGVQPEAVGKAVADETDMIAHRAVMEALGFLIIKGAEEGIVKGRLLAVDGLFQNVCHTRCNCCNGSRPNLWICRFREKPMLYAVPWKNRHHNHWHTNHAQ